MAGNGLKILKGAVDKVKNQDIYVHERPPQQNCHVTVMIYLLRRRPILIWSNGYVHIYID